MRSIPEPGTYGRVLRRYDRAAHLPLRFASYDVNIVAVPAELNGTMAATLFFPCGKEIAAQRALRLGWQDETDLWMKWVGAGQEAAGGTTAPLGHALSQMEWNDLTAYARKLKLKSSGKRPEVEARIIAHFQRSDTAEG